MMRRIKMKKVKILSAILVVVLLFTLVTGCSSNKTGGQTDGSDKETTGTTAEYTWKLSHSRAEKSRNDLLADELIKRIYDASNGRIVIQKYPNNSLGDYTIVQERVSIGDVEMMLASGGNTVNRGILLPIIPYLFSNWDEALKYINNDGTGLIYNGMEHEFSKINIKLLGFCPMYFGSVALCKDIGDLVLQPAASKGLKVRVPSAQLWEALGNSIGFISTPMAAADAYTAMQTGIVDGMIGGGAEAYWSNYRDVTKYLLPINTHFECHYLTINKELFESLPKDLQDILVEQGKWLQETAIKNALEEEQLYFDKFREIGVEVYDVPDSVIKEYANLYRKAYWDKIPAEIGESAGKVFEQVRSELGI
jgi:TRAP-type C4-dicarboxylate transport system substrate-binding protein